MASDHEYVKDDSYPDYVDMHIAVDGIKLAYCFHFFKNKYGRYVALCSTVGCESFYGEGYTWDAALAECMKKVYANVYPSSLKKYQDQKPEVSVKSVKLAIGGKPESKVLIKPDEYAYTLNHLNDEQLSDFIDSAFDSGDGFYHSQVDKILYPIEDLISELSRRMREHNKRVATKKKG